MSAEHSVIPPSSASIWGKPDGCPGWSTMILCVPEDNNYREERLEGNAAHEVAARLTQEIARGPSNLTPADKLVGTFSREGLLITQEMYDCARIHAEHCLSIMRRINVFMGPFMGTEKRLAAPSIHPANFGTVDFYTYGRTRGRSIDIVDYKHGHATVDAYENRQLLNYLAGILDLYRVDGIEDQNTETRLHIVQPRAYRAGRGAIDTWGPFPASDARAYINQLRAGAIAAMGPNPKCRSGAHCKNCDARLYCEAAIEAGLGMYETIGRITPHNLTPGQLAALADILLRAEQQIGALSTAVRSQIDTLIRTGVNVPNYRLKGIKARRKWTRPIDELIALAAGFGLDISKPGILTPPQAQKAGLAPEIVDMYSHRPNGGHTLERITTAEGRRIFT